MREMEIEIVQELSGKYVIINAEKSQDFSNYDSFGTEMLRYNEIEGVVGAGIHHVDDRDQYVYFVHDWSPVTEWFAENRLNAGELIEILGQLEQTIKNCQSFFLKEENLLLQSENMFYDKKQRRLNILYLEEYGQPVAEGIGRLLERFMDTMNHNDKELVFLVYGLHRICRDKNFSLTMLTDFLREQTKTGSRKDRQIRDLPAEKRQIETAPPFQAGRKGKQAAKPEKELPFFSDHVKIVLSLAAGLLVFAVLFQTGFLTQPVSGGIDWKKAAALAAVLVLAEIWAVEKLRGSKEEDTEPKEAEEDKTTLLVSAGSDETILLENGSDTKWYVNLMPKDWQRPEIKMRKSPFFIGKDAGKADGVIGENDVSRIHAKLVTEDGGVFLIDQESTNGTYVNGTRLIPWERRQITSGDIIGFSSVYYQAELYQ